MNKLILNAATIRTNTGTIDVSWSDDDYYTFTVPRTINIEDDNKYLKGCGSFIQRAIRLSYTGASNIKWSSLDLEITQGIS